MIYLIYQRISRNSVWIDHRSPFSKQFKGNLRFLEEYPKKLILSSQESIFMRSGLTEYAQNKFQTKMMRHHLIGQALPCNFRAELPALTLKIRLLDPILLN